MERAELMARTAMFLSEFDKAKAEQATAPTTEPREVIETRIEAIAKDAWAPAGNRKQRRAQASRARRTRG
jgi:hypothetical protein